MRADTSGTLAPAANREWVPFYGHFLKIEPKARRRLRAAGVSQNVSGLFGAKQAGNNQPETFRKQAAVYSWYRMSMETGGTARVPRTLRPPLGLMVSPSTATFQSPGREMLAGVGRPL